jgi:Polyketide cyclase / dehydrase and lipid transport.
MAIDVTITTRIARTPGDVFAALIAVERFPEWLIASGIVGVERVDAGALHVGSRLTIRQVVAGRSTVIDAQVTVVSSDTAFAVRGRDPDGVSVEFEAGLAPDGDAATTLSWSARIRLPLKYRMFESMVGPQARRAAALDIEALKRRLESPDR